MQGATNIDSADAAVLSQLRREEWVSQAESRDEGSGEYAVSAADTRRAGYDSDDSHEPQQVGHTSCSFE